MFDEAYKIRKFVAKNMLCSLVPQILNFLDSHLANLFDLLAIGACFYKFYTSCVCLLKKHDL